MKLMVFTDLDGTLLDHRNYGFEPARPALEALGALGVPLILATSKTAAEIGGLYRALGLAPWPAIVENGAALARPGDAAGDNGDYKRIRAALDALPGDLRAAFRGFGDMEAGEVAGVTGLSAGAAAQARRRCHTEPGLWDGSPEDEARFLGALADAGITGRRGGRFLTLSLGRTKADQMRRLIGAHAPRHTLALGDAPNDIEMLETASIGVIVRNDHGTGIAPLAGEGTGRIRRTREEGPSGWRDAVMEVLTELGMNEGGG